MCVSQSEAELEGVTELCQLDRLMPNVICNLILIPMV